VNDRPGCDLHPTGATTSCSGCRARMDIPPPPYSDHRDIYIRDTPSGPELVFLTEAGNARVIGGTLADLWKTGELIEAYKQQIVAVEAWWQAEDGTIVYSVRQRGGLAYATHTRPGLPLERFPRSDELVTLWKAIAEEAGDGVG
jgi:hypothetical protein